jgi:hypothetical protein
VSYQSLPEQARQELELLALPAARLPCSANKLAPAVDAASLSQMTRTTGGAQEKGFRDQVPGDANARGWSLGEHSRAILERAWGLGLPGLGLRGTVLGVPVSLVPRRIPATVFSNLFYDIRCLPEWQGTIPHGDAM